MGSVRFISADKLINMTLWQARSTNGTGISGSVSPSESTSENVHAGPNILAGMLCDVQVCMAPAQGKARATCR